MNTAPGAHPARHKAKVCINVVIGALAGRRRAETDGTADHPRPPEPRHKPIDKNPDAGSLKSFYRASLKASGLLRTFLASLGTRSWQGSGTDPAPPAPANTEWRTETGADVITAATLWLGDRADGLTGEEVWNLNAVLAQAMADNTKANYRAQWRRFTAWARARGVRALPADSPHVAAYLAERLERDAHRPATLRTAAAVIAYIHRAAGLANPCAAAAVRHALSGSTRKAGRMQKQADALTADALALIQATACQPRLGRGGRRESRTTAGRRGRVDVALISLMRDAMLRVSEAAALTWADISAERDGTGRLLIRRSKTDPAGAGAVLFLSAPTMARLALIQDGESAGSSVFRLRHNQLAKRIKQAALAAGLGEGFSGHSPRVGMARDLARAGIELPRLMTAGRWRSPTMPALYTRNETAGRGAVAQFYGNRQHPAGAGEAATRKDS